MRAHSTYGGAATSERGYGDRGALASWPKRSGAEGHTMTTSEIRRERNALFTPGDLDFVHFTSGGSEAVEVALKMARQYHVLRGEPDRSVLISRWTSYHGATIGGLMVGGSKLRRQVYEPLLPDRGSP